MHSLLKTLRAVGLGALLLWPCFVHAAPAVVASIKPLQLIAAAITEGLSTPQVILLPGRDPHHMSLRPSDRQALGDAAIVLWVGPALELPLDKVITQSKAIVLTAQNLSGMTLVKSGTTTDPHLWLDSRNARVIATALRDALVKLDAGNAARYSANLQKVIAMLDATDTELTTEFSAVKNQAWAVSHQAFRYVVQQRQLQEPLALTDSNNSSASVQRVLTLQKQMDAQQVRCLITEPSDNHQQLNALIEGKRFRIVAADTLGSAVAVAADGYVRMLREVSKTLYQCIGGRYE